MGIYYATPLLGPSLGPIIGGAATKLFSWRATFYFLAIFGGLSLLTFVFFKDTFRRERSLTYQNALKRLANEEKKKIMDQENKETERSAEEATESSLDKLEAQLPSFQDVRLSFRHLSLIRPIVLVMKRINNFCILVASGIYP
jgi:MFS family permease